MRKHLGPLLIAAAVYSAPALAEPTFVGIWYSANQPDEPSVMSLIEFRADGTFREEFRKCENGTVAGYQFESGTWAVMDGMERLVVDKVYGDSTPIEAIYLAELLTNSDSLVQ